jgi:hypothetical protein
MPYHLRLALAAATSLGFVTAGPGAAWAQQQLPPGMQAEANALAQACRPDFTRLCSGVQPGGGRVLACLQQQQPNKLSPACREALPKAAALQSRAAESGLPPR